MNDTIDSEIRKALAVLPSPDFVARTRRRVAAEPTRRVSAWWIAATVPAAAAIAWLVVVGRGSAPAAPLLVSRGVPPIEVPFVRPAAGADHGAGPRHIGSATPGVPHAGRAGRPTPPVLIDAREARAIRAFLAAASAGRIEITPVADPVPAMAPELKQNIYIAPIVIEPLTTADRPEGVPK